MEIIYQYDIFREKCFEFANKFEQACFSNAALVCHPTCQNEIITLCSDEEAKTNGLNICRMSDMLLMSDDNESWETFNLARARAIAAENGYIYITDILAESSFYAEEWMIDGKHDTIVVSEQYMREKGKKYAPVTPLTNKVLHFKKISDPFFWTPSEPGKLNLLNTEGIQKRFDDYFNECAENIPSLAQDDRIEFPIFNTKVEINPVTTRALKTDVIFEQINRILDVFANVNDFLAQTDYSFSPVDFVIEIFVAALNSNGIEVSKQDFVEKYYTPLVEDESFSRTSLYTLLSARYNEPSIVCAKIAFINVLKAEAAFEYVYPLTETLDYSKNMRDLEQSDYNDMIGESEEKAKIVSILSGKPADYVIFGYILKRYPDEYQNVANIAEFWGIEPISDNELQSVIFHSYINDSLFNENGEFVSGLDQAQIIRDQLIKVNQKYGFENVESINELDEYITAADLKRRTYNGTVFDTPEDMKRAMANELELQALCTNLGALDESELRDLVKHINGITADDTTRAKYLVKVKIAQNRCEESMLEQLCLSLPMMDANETIALKNQVENCGYAESVVKPKLADIIDHLNSSLRTELDNIVSKLDTMTDDAISVAAEAIASDRYPSVLSEHYLRIIESHTENKIKAEIEAVYNDVDSLDLAGLKDVREQLLSERFPRKYTAIFIADIDTRIANYEKNEVTKLFENIDFADSDELDKISAIIEERNFSPALLEPYAGRIENRRQEINDEELNVMCADIEDMAQDKLDEVKAAVTSSDKYSEDLVAKIMDRIERRECELKNTELAELCKYIFDMDQAKLDELKDVLTSDKYDQSLTTIYLKKISEREEEIKKSELEKLCEGISDLTEEELLKLKADITENERYEGLCEPFCEKIDTCIDNIKYKEFNELLDTVDTMDTAALDAFRLDMEARREELGEEQYARSMDKAAARADAIEIEKLDSIIDDIDNMDVAGAFAAINEINAGSYTQEHKYTYTEKLENKIEELYTRDLDSLTDGIEDMDKEQLTAVIAKISDYDCPAENKAPYIHKVEKQISSLAEKEIRDICGDINSLSVKKCFDIIVRIRTLSLDESIKNQYLDSIEAHILAIKEDEQNDYITFLKSKINELNVSTVNFLVPSISNLFYQKYGEASKTYVSSGRYELPIFMHENDANNGFTLTTEYFYYISKGVFNRIKIDELVSFQAKKGLMGTSVTVTVRNGNTSEISCAINKQSIDATTKAMTALINYIKDKRSAERMKELLENAVNERAQDTEVVKPEPIKETAPVQEPEPPVVEETVTSEETPAEEVVEETVENTEDTTEVSDKDAPAEEETDDKAEPDAAVTEQHEEEAPKVKFCDQCGAKITSATAKFCAECGNKLF